MGSDTRLNLKDSSMCLDSAKKICVIWINKNLKSSNCIAESVTDVCVWCMLPPNLLQAELEVSLWMWFVWVGRDARWHLWIMIWGWHICRSHGRWTNAVVKFPSPNFPVPCSWPGNWAHPWLTGPASGSAIFEWGAVHVNGDRISEDSVEKQTCKPSSS